MTGAPEMARCNVCGELHPVATMVTAHKQAEEIPADARRERPAPRDWWLSDARALHAEHPRSFFIPTAERSRALVPGELVKLGFAYGPHADREGEGHLERMWVEVLAQGGSGPADASAGLLTDRFPGLAEPLRAGTGVWEIAGGERETARWAPRRRGRALRRRVARSVPLARADGRRAARAPPPG